MHVHSNISLPECTRIIFMVGWREEGDHKLSIVGVAPIQLMYG